MVGKLALAAASAPLLMLPAAGMAISQPAHASAVKIHSASTLAEPDTSDWYYTLNCEPGGRCTTAVKCTSGGHAVLFSPAAFPTVHNYCAGRIWLHENRNGTGYSLCISPDTATGYLKRLYEDAQVTTNKAKC